MGRTIFCDMCGMGVPIETNLQQVMIGDQAVAEVCFNCASSLKTAINNKRTEVMQKSIPGNNPEAKPAEQPVAQPTPQGTPIPGEKKDSAPEQVNQNA